MSENETSGEFRHSRRSFMTRASLIGAASLLPLTAFLKSASAHDDDDYEDRDNDGLCTVDRDILTAASIAEALAVTTYSHIISDAPFFGRLPDDAVEAEPKLFAVDE